MLKKCLSSCQIGHSFIFFARSGNWLVCVFTLSHSSSDACSCVRKRDSYYTTDVFTTVAIPEQVAWFERFHRPAPGERIFLRIIFTTAMHHHHQSELGWLVLSLAEWRRKILWILFVFLFMLFSFVSRENASWAHVAHSQMPKELKQRMQDYFQTMWSLNHGIDVYEVGRGWSR